MPHLNLDLELLDEIETGMIFRHDNTIIWMNRQAESYLAHVPFDRLPQWLDESMWEDQGELSFYVWKLNYKVSKVSSEHGVHQVYVLKESKEFVLDVAEITEKISINLQSLLEPLNQLSAQMESVEEMNQVRKPLLCFLQKQRNLMLMEESGKVPTASEPFLPFLTGLLKELEPCSKEYGCEIQWRVQSKNRTSIKISPFHLKRAIYNLFSYSVEVLQEAEDKTIYLEFQVTVTDVFFRVITYGTKSGYDQNFNLPTVNVLLEKMSARGTPVQTEDGFSYVCQFVNGRESMRSSVPRTRGRSHVMPEDLAGHSDLDIVFSQF